MDPISAALGILVPLITAAKAALVMVNKYKASKRTEENALRDLRRAVESMVRDGNDYKVILLEILKDKRGAERFRKSMVYRDALRRFKVALEDAIAFLQSEQVSPAEKMSGDQDVRPKLPVPALVVSFVKTNLFSNTDAVSLLTETTKDVRFHLERCKESFECVWKLYQLSQRRLTRSSSVDSVRTQLSIPVPHDLTPESQLDTRSKVSVSHPQEETSAESGDLTPTMERAESHEFTLGRPVRSSSINSIRTIVSIPPPQGSTGGLIDYPTNHRGQAVGDFNHQLLTNHSVGTIRLPLSIQTFPTSHNITSADDHMVVSSLVNESTGTTPSTTRFSGNIQGGMDSVSTAIDIVMLTIAAAKVAIAMIDKQIETKRAEESSIKDLRVAIDALKSDGNMYDLLLGTMLNAEDSRPLTKMENSKDGKDAVGRLIVALGVTRLLLERNQVATAEADSQEQQDKPKRPPIEELIKSFLKANFTPNDGTADAIKDTAKDLDICRSNCEREFKLVWHLYVIYQQQPPRSRSIDMHHKAAKSVSLALDDVLNSFYKKPFAASADGTDRTSYSSLAKLNRDNECARKHEDIMRRAGTAWVQDTMDTKARRNLAGKAISQVKALGQLQTTLFELMWTNTVEQLKRHGSGWTASEKSEGARVADPEQVEFQKDLTELENTLQEAILRAKKQRFAISFCGMVKAGKSLFLNALIGEPILPSDELLSTAWPCRLRHVPKQTVPELTFDDDPFIGGLAALQRARYGAKLEAYEPPSEDPYDTMSDESSISEPSQEEVKLKELYSKWVDLHAATKRNLMEFENPQFRLPKRARGPEKLSQLNDIVRLCHRFGLPFKMDDVEWPLLTVEFNSLRGHQMDGVYEFIDLPGIGEHFETFDFENLVRLVAKDSNAIVPIISFKELARSDWKKLLDIVANGFGGRASVVVCTHLDQIPDHDCEKQFTAVSKVFWPRDVQTATSRIIPCSSLMGLSARALLDLSIQGKPEFATFWNDSRHGVPYACAEKILGTGQPEQHYNNMNSKLWLNKLEYELKHSGLPGAIKKLTREIVDQAKQRAFLLEGECVCKQLRKINSAQERKLLEPRRSKNESEDAKREYDKARAKFLQLIDAWNVEEMQQTINYRGRLSKGIEALRKRCSRYITSCIKCTLNDWSHSSIKQSTEDIILKGPESARAQEKGGVTVLVVKNPAHAEEFLRLSQRELQVALNREKQDFVTAVRKMAKEARGRQFQTLKDEIARLDPSIQPELREEIMDDLNNSSVDVRQVAFHQIRNQVKEFKLSMDFLEAQYREKIVDPWLRALKEDSEKTILGAISTSSQVAKAAVENALSRENLRYQRETEFVNSSGKAGMVQHMVALSSSLWAADSALITIQQMLKDCLDSDGNSR